MFGPSEKEGIDTNQPPIQNTELTSHAIKVQFHELLEVLRI